MILDSSRYMIHDDRPIGSREAPIHRLGRVWAYWFYIERLQCSVLNAELSIGYNVEPSPTRTFARNHWLDQLSRCRPFLASEEVWRAQR